MKLIELVKKDIEKFLRGNGQLFFNERDLQMHLAIYLKTSDNAYDDVEVEYYVPVGVDNSSMKSGLYLDIVVKNGGEYLPTELKYKTKSLNNKINKMQKPLLRLGKMVSVDVLKNQSAQDIGMYLFWKDVWRIELIRREFEQVKNGLAVFVTNDKAYQNRPKETTNHYMFSMNADVLHQKQKYWLYPESKCAQMYKGFEVEKEYEIEWHNLVAEEVDLYYCIVNI